MYREDRSPPDYLTFKCSLIYTDKQSLHISKRVTIIPSKANPKWSYTPVTGMIELKYTYSLKNFSESFVLIQFLSTKSDSAAALITSAGFFSVGSALKVFSVATALPISWTASLL